MLILKVYSFILFYAPTSVSINLLFGIWILLILLLVFFFVAVIFVVCFSVTRLFVFMFFCYSCYFLFLFFIMFPIIVDVWNDLNTVITIDF